MSRQTNQVAAKLLCALWMAAAWECVQPMGRVPLNPIQCRLEIPTDMCRGRACQKSMALGIRLATQLAVAALDTAASVSPHDSSHSVKMSFIHSPAKEGSWYMRATARRRCVKRTGSGSQQQPEGPTRSKQARHWNGAQERP